MSEAGARRQRVFISYSRREFAFAEETAAVLAEHAGLDPWLDVQRLRPGTDWERALDDGLDQADVLLLLVSPSAIGSAYVRHEWTRALDRGIPVHLGVVEAADLPEELHGLPVHDLRTRFWRRAAALGDAIASPVVQPATAAPRPNRWGLPRLPVPVLATVVLAALTLAGLGWACVLVVATDLRIAGLTFDPFGGTGWTRQTALTALRQKYWLALLFLLVSLTVMAIAALVGVAVAGAGLLRRRSRASTVQYAFLAAAGTALALGYLAQVVAGTVRLPGVADGWYVEEPLRTELYGTPPEVTGALNTATVLAIAVLVCALAGLTVMTAARTVRLWLPTATGPRRRHLPVLSYSERVKAFTAWPGYYANLPADQKGVNPRLVLEHFLAEWAAPSGQRDTPAVGVRCLAPADEPVAREIRAACRRAGLPESATPRWTLVLVSSQVAWADAAETIRSLGARAIGVLVDTMPLPADDEDLRRHQWLDFRERRTDTLLFLLSSLRSPAAEPVRDGMAPTPLVPDRFLAPPEVRVFAHYCRTAPAFAVAFSLACLLFRPLEWQPLTLGALATALLWCLLRLDRLVATRTTTAAGFRGRYWTAWTLMALWTGVAISILYTPVLADHGAYPPGRGEPAVLLPVVLVLLLVLLANTVCFALHRPLRRRWLPPAVTRTRPPRVSTGAFTVITPVLAAAGLMVALSVQLTRLP
ncbi:toll/interleukin-1 receptor domain-containing protein [Nocardia sp. NRRL S-836]|uniref:toll/interleukin-1 receptor domain-containing protein n=1 Tax=Nocardia sp. NRRL S-836 TaxID=1519492 RepID=UPI0018D14F2A|nr:toll/interleukin-1 receptor domain-containing protein [Nocardia sp. NRRL S-836]